MLNQGWPKHLLLAPSLPLWNQKTESFSKAARVAFTWFSHPFFCFWAPLIYSKTAYFTVPHTFLNSLTNILDTYGLVSSFPLSLFLDYLTLLSFYLQRSPLFCLSVHQIKKTLFTQYFPCHFHQTATFPQTELSPPVTVVSPDKMSV